MILAAIKAKLGKILTVKRKRLKMKDIVYDDR